MPEVDPWEAYFYPETIDAMGQGTLRNKYELRDSEVLRFTECRGAVPCWRRGRVRRSRRVQPRGARRGLIQVHRPATELVGVVRW